MGGIEHQCQTPNGEEVLSIHDIDGDVFVVTSSQVYRMLYDEVSVRLLPVHQFMQPGHA